MNLKLNFEYPLFEFPNYDYKPIDDHTINKIIHNLYLTGDVGSRNYNELKKLGIKQILTVGNELQDHNNNEFLRLRINIDDNPGCDIKQYFIPCIEFIKNAPTVVHCKLGISRSATIVIAYLMKIYNMTLQNALILTRSQRSIINPNNGFLNQLILFEKELNTK